MHALDSPAPQRQGVWPVCLLLCGLLSACQTPPPPAPKPPPPQAVVPPPASAPVSAAPALKTSQAQTPREYRKDAAAHLYSLNKERIYTGMMPPLLYAVGVLQVELDKQGQVLGTSWMREPRHAPEVVAEIERIVRRAAPYPVASRLGRVTYTDVWLWDKSGRFQLDTLTEGQR